MNRPPDDPETDQVYRDYEDLESAPPAGKD